jgi:hypothetical protein
MKSVFIAAVLVATSIAASADHHDFFREEAAASGPGKTRAEVIAELKVAMAAGQIHLNDRAMRQADSLHLQTPTSSLTRQQVRQEVLALRNQGLLNIQGEH